MVPFNGNLLGDVDEILGETVTIFTESGGASGCGFTGTILRIGPCVVRLITCIGPAPGCALGNGCSGSNGMPRGGFGPVAGYGPMGGYGGFGGGYGGGCGRVSPAFGFGCPPPQSCFQPILTIGSIVDIPIDKIVAIVRNAV